MAVQRDEVGEVISVNGRTLAIIDLARIRAERAEERATASEGHAVSVRAAFTAADEKRRQAEASASFWHAEARDLAGQLRGSRRREWLMVALCALVGVLALTLWAVALGLV